MKTSQYIKAIEENNIVSKTDTEGIITYVNDEFCKISKYSKDELIGKNHNIVRHPDVPKSTFKKLWDTIKAKKTYKATVKNLAKDGSPFYVNTTIIPILDEHGEIVEYIAIRYDVTNEILLQQELEKKQKLIFWQSRFASMGEMMANIAHQWRQPLAELNFILFNMKKFRGDEERFLEYYSQAKESIQNMSKTIEDFTNFFNPNRPKQTFYIAQAVNEAVGLLEKILKKEGIAFKLNLDTSLKTSGIPNELTQVLINLIQNSKDAFLGQKKQKYIEINLFKKDGFAYIRVLDNAGGIDEEIIDKIFEPYFTTKHSSRGMGLGLFMSKMVIEQGFGGFISVKNAGEGALFDIKLVLE